MNVSLFALFSIGIGPSSSHTVGPMKAACSFAEQLQHLQLLAKVSRVTVELYGSLALTGKGHCTDKAILMGLQGESPQTIDPDSIDARVKHIHSQSQINLNGHHLIYFDQTSDLQFHYHETLPKHSNGMHFTAFDQHGKLLNSQIFYSIGSGFIVTDETFDQPQSQQNSPVPFPFGTAEELLGHCHRHHLNISQVMFANENVWRSETEIRQKILEIDKVMAACIHKGCTSGGYLPGPLKVLRRAPALYQKLLNQGPATPEHPSIMNWLNLYAMAVNEENAAGGKIVTAPTNGAAGILPSVLNYYKNFCPNADEEGVITFLLTAAAITVLYKTQASISGAEMGCQGEVGVACSIAAAGLTAALGGTPEQVENAAEIGIEHNLGLTCDPIGGYVQIPCIERNAIGAVKAVNASLLARSGDGRHKISLDNAIDTMRRTGKDMSTKYKETSLGGLAALPVSMTEC